MVVRPRRLGKNEMNRMEMSDEHSAPKPPLALNRLSLLNALLGPSLGCASLLATSFITKPPKCWFCFSLSGSF